MNRALRVLLALTLLTVFWSALIGGAMLLLPTDQVAAQPPPAKSPVPPTDVPPTVQPSEPTVAPPEPTKEPLPEPTKELPTVQPEPQPTTIEPAAPPNPEPVQEPEGESEPDPNCQSVLEGYVANAAGNKVPGASVKVEGEGWSRGMMTDDGGHYGFGGLCASEATLAAVLPGGQTSASATVSIDGKNKAEVDLFVGQSKVAQPTATVLATATTQTASVAATAEPGMPSTGFPGWILIGIALIGAVAILTVGTCRILVVRLRSSQSHNR